MSTKNLVWFRHDLRLADNPALYEACQLGEIIPLYIFDDTNPCPNGQASHAFLLESLKHLDQSLDHHLLIFKGDPKIIIPKLMQDEGCSAIFWNRCYTPHAIARDAELKKNLTANAMSAHSFQASLLWEPWTIKNQQGEHYKVFTPYYKKGCLQAPTPRAPLAKPTIHYAKTRNHATWDLQKSLNDSHPWITSMLSHWQIGENAAQQHLHFFIENNLQNYALGRDLPALEATSRLSPYLHAGQLSPNQIFHAIHDLHLPDQQTEAFLRELGWREFSYYLLYYFPNLPTHNYKSSFDAFPWINQQDDLVAWQKGLTGYPLVDAGMRELWLTGTMHNRVRMITASFLIKNLLIDWRLGQDWFWQCLVDADLASNSASWQWVAGSGADAAPFFRIFNPVTQSKKFDSEGEYIRRFIPELKNLDNPFIHDPSNAPSLVLKAAHIVLGKDYPKAIVDLKSTHARALQSYKKATGKEYIPIR